MKDVFTRIAMILLAIIIIGCVGYLIYYEINLNNSYSVTYRVVDEYDTEYRGNDKELDWDSLQEENGDTVGWLKIKGTDINTPIVQADDNEYYLRKDFNKNYSYSGTPFLDYRNNSCNKENEDNADEFNQNTIIYGHNMRDNKGFSELLSIYNNAESAKGFKYIQYDTPGNKNDWVVLGAFYTNSNPKDDNDYCFPYNTPIMSYGNFADFTEQLRQRFIFTSGVDFNHNDKLLMLSTCSYTYKDERFVVVARQLREDETKEEMQFEFKDNLLPRYPQKWYDKNRMNNPYVNYPQWVIT